MRPKQFDFVHSIIVLQHMVPQLQQVYLEQMRETCSSLGAGLDPDSNQVAGADGARYVQPDQTQK